MKKIHDLLKARKKHLHETHSKKPLQTHFHSPIASACLLRDKEKGTVGCVAQQTESETSVRPATPEPPKKSLPAYTEAQLPAMRFFRPKQTVSSEKEGSKKEEGEEGGKGSVLEKLDREHMAGLRALLNDVMQHPGALTPHMFWVLFMKVTPHFSLLTAGSVRVSALFWLMLAYIKAKNKNKRRQLKEQLKEAATLLEKNNDQPMVRVRRRV